MSLNESNVVKSYISAALYGLFGSGIATVGRAVRGKSGSHGARKRRYKNKAQKLARRANRK